MHLWKNIRFVLISLVLLRVCQYEILTLVSLTLFLNLVAQLSFVYISLPFFPVVYKSLSFKPPWRGGAVPRVPPYALQRYKHGIGEVASELILVGIPGAGLGCFPEPRSQFRRTVQYPERCSLIWMLWVNIRLLRAKEPHGIANFNWNSWKNLKGTMFGVWSSSALGSPL